MAKITKTYYINLEHREDRNKNIIEQKSKSKFLEKNLLRYNGIDGKKLNILQISNDILTKKGRNIILSNKVHHWGVDLTYGSMGCALSHYYLYKECLENNYNSILIFEDDIIIDDKIDSYIEEIEKLDFTEFDILYLGCHHKPSIKPTANKLFKRVFSNIYGAFAYLVTQQGAKNLLEKIFPISVQFDSEILKKIYQQKLIAYITNPKIVTSSDVFQSDNQGKFGLLPSSKFINVYDAWDIVFNNK
jgi:GR25 family glycosyltransferase involved in LPS biosynthesis